MKIGPLFKWYGSKWQSAKHYPQPMHDTIIEPYAGGAGYSLNYVDKRVCIWDADPLLQELWQWLITNANETYIRRIPVGLPVGTNIQELDFLNRGQKLLLKHWQRTNNVGDCWTISPWGHLPGRWTENTRARVAEEVVAIKHWQFTRPSALLDIPATWYIDPPYQYNYRYRNILPDFKYESLARHVGRISPQSLVIVCEAVCKKTGAIPDYLPFEPSHRSVTSRRKATQSHHSSELVYIRRPIERTH